MASPGPAFLALLKAQTGCEYWRVVSPIAALQRCRRCDAPPERCACPLAGHKPDAYPAYWLHVDDPKGVDLVPYMDAVGLTRLSWDESDYAEGERWVASLHAAGKAVVYEVDDDLFTDAFFAQGRVLEPEKPHAVHAQERAERIHALRLCDGVTVPTQRLATVVRQFTEKPVVVVPNAIDWPRWQASCARGTRPAPAGRLVGWAGGKRADADVAPMAAAWGRIARRFGDVQFVVVGHQPDILTEAVPAERLHLLPWTTIRTYPRQYHGWDIGCAPLADTPFNRCKSPIKTYEYAAAGAAVVASPTVYGKELRDGRDGYLAASADDWESALGLLLEDDGRRKQMAARWAKRVRERYSLAQNLWRWPSAWQTIVQSFRASRAGLVRAG